MTVKCFTIQNGRLHLPDSAVNTKKGEQFGVLVVDTPNLKELNVRQDGQKSVLITIGGVNLLLGRSSLLEWLSRGKTGSAKPEDFLNEIEQLNLQERSRALLNVAYLAAAKIEDFVASATNSEQRGKIAAEELGVELSPRVAKAPYLSPRVAKAPYLGALKSAASKALNATTSAAKKVAGGAAALATKDNAKKAALSAVGTAAFAATFFYATPENINALFAPEPVVVEEAVVETSNAIYALAAAGLALAGYGAVKAKQFVKEAAQLASVVSQGL